MEVLERKLKTQEILFNLLISERDLERLLSISLFDNIRKEAYEFVQEKIHNFEDNSRSRERDHGPYRNSLRTRLDFLSDNLLANPWI